MGPFPERNRLMTLIVCPSSLRPATRLGADRYPQGVESYVHRSMAPRARSTPAPTHAVTYLSGRRADVPNAELAFLVCGWISNLKRAAPGAREREMGDAEWAD